MRSQNNKVKNSTGAASSKSGKLGKNSDVDSRLLQQLSSKMGNQGLSDRLQQNSVQRDQLLQFICARLNNIQQIQQIELDEVSQRPEWFREVAKGENGFFLPDPERWKESATLYKKAGQALCQGNVSKGKQLLEEALKKEEATRDSLPEQVNERLESKEQEQTGAPVSTSTEGAEVCPARNTPQELKVADKILAVRATVRNAPPVRKTRPFNWWEEVEESEEDAHQDNEQEQAEEQAEEKTEEEIDKESHDKDTPIQESVTKEHTSIESIRLSTDPQKDT